MHHFSAKTATHNIHIYTFSEIQRFLFIFETTSLSTQKYIFSYNTLSLSLLWISCVLLYNALQSYEKYYKRFSFLAVLLVASYILLIKVTIGGKTIYAFALLLAQIANVSICIYRYSDYRNIPQYVII